MTKTETANLAATMEQIRKVADAGADIVRCAVPRDEDVEALKTIVKESPIPVIADIHFNHTLALKAIDAGAHCIRLNPGNIGGREKVAEVAVKATAAGVPMRIGYLFNANPAVGASGAIFGLFGLVFVSVWVHKPALARQARALTSQIGILIIINLVIGFAPGSNIDYMAHIGGLLVGAWLGFVIPPRGAATLASFWQRPPAQDGQTSSRGPALLAVGGVLLLGIVLVVALQLTPFWASAA